MEVNPTDKNSGYTAPAIGRAAALLDYISTCRLPPTLSNISRALGYGKSTTHGLLNALEQQQWVMRADGGYRLGAGLLGLMRRAYGCWNVATLARPFMEKLSASLGVSVCVGRIEGAKAKIEDCVEGRSGMRIALEPGIVLPDFAGAVGKVVLAGLSPGEAETAVSGKTLPRFTDRSITDPALYLKEVAACRARGYGLDDQEYLPGVRAVAAPIARDGRIVSVLWVVGLTPALASEAMEPAAIELAEAARVISTLIGTASHPPS